MLNIHSEKLNCFTTISYPIIYRFWLRTNISSMYASTRTKLLSKKHKAFWSGLKSNLKNSLLSFSCTIGMSLFSAIKALSELIDLSLWISFSKPRYLNTHITLNIGLHNAFLKSIWWTIHFFCLELAIHKRTKAKSNTSAKVSCRKWYSSLPQITSRTL